MASVISSVRAASSHSQRASSSSAALPRCDGPTIVASVSPRLAHRGRRVEVAGAAVEVLFQRALVAHAELLEVRLAAFQERVHALEALLRAPHMREQLHAVLPRGVELVGLEVEALLGHAQRLRAVALDGLAPDQ